MAVKFFHKLNNPIEVLLHMRTPKRKQDMDREIPITFRMTLDGNTVRSAPPFVRSAYEEIKKGADVVGLKKEIENVNVELYNLPEKKRPDFHLPRLNLTGLKVLEVKTSKSDTTTVLTFETLYPWDEEIWKYLGEHYGSSVFAKFDSAQAELSDLEESDEKGEEVAEEEEEAVEQ